jgi:VanZ family protein
LDKLLHVQTNFIVVTLASIWSLWLAVAIAVVLSIGKEVFDYFRYGREVDNFKRMVIGDLIADAVGIVGGIIWNLI